MKKRNRILLVGLLAVVLGGLGWLVVRSQSERLIQGKTEAAWIKSINYNGGSAETEQWRALGPVGIQMLIHALNAGNGPLESRYARLWPRLPPFIRSRLPTPVDSYPTRMCAVSMLNRLEPDAKSAVPALVKALKKEKTDGGRQSIIGCFSFEYGLLNGMEKEKAELLPDLIGAMQSSDWGIRNNAALALGCYSERAQVVTPVLLNATRDPVIHVRLAALMALSRVDPKTLAKPEVVQIVIDLLKGPDDQVGFEAALLLGQIGKESPLAVPALIESARGTNSLVAQTAARALKRIDPEAAAQAGVK